jgi:hypothetical protein
VLRMGFRAFALGTACRWEGLLDLQHPNGEFSGEVFVLIQGARLQVGAGASACGELGLAGTCFSVAGNIMTSYWAPLRVPEVQKRFLRSSERSKGP